MKSKYLIVLAIVMAILAGTFYLFLQVSGADQPKGTPSASAKAPNATKTFATKAGITPEHNKPNKVGLKANSFPSPSLAMPKKIPGYQAPQQPIPPGIPKQEGGETCASATVISSLPYNATGYTCDNVDDYEEMNGGTCPYSSNSPDVVYSYAPATNQTINIALCASLYDTKVFVYQDACASGTAIACNDDACGSDGYKSAIYGLSVSAGHTYYIVVDGYGGSCGDYVLSVTGPCTVVCPSGGIPEGEPTCYDEYVDNYNGGCNWGPPYLFQPINCGDVICGTSGTYLYTGLEYREMDWFRLVITQPTYLTWWAVGEFPTRVWILNAGSENCSDMTTIASVGVGMCDTAKVSANVQPGVYWLLVAPDAFAGYPCGVKYVAKVECGTAPPPPPNDNCENATSKIGDVTNLAFSTSLATFDGPGLCQTAPNIWYCYTASCTGNAHIALCGSSYDTKLAAYDGCTCPPTTMLGCNDDACGGTLQSEVYIPVVQGNQYLIEVGGYGSSTGDGLLSISCAQPSTGDNCSSPKVIPDLPANLPYSDVGQTTCGRLHDYDYMTCLNPYDGGEDMIYELNVTQAFTADITMNPNGTYWTGIAIDAACPPGTPCLGYATDYTGLPYGIHCVHLDPGTYYIMVDTWPSPDCISSFDLTISSSGGTPPANDECTGAPVIGTFPQTVYGTTVGACPDCPDVLNWPAVWYQFDLPYTCNNLTVDFCATDWSIQQIGIVVYNSCPPVCASYMATTGYQWLSCENGTSNPQLWWNNLPGPASYWFPVYPFAAASFGFTVSVEECVPCVLTCPPNGIPEGEPACYDGYVDNYNGGCNSSPYVWQNINCHDTICGTSGVYSANSYRDTDWFRVQAGAGNLTWTCVAEFPVLLFIMDAGSEDCVDYTQLASNYTYNVCDTISVSAYVPGGVYWVWVGPVDWGNYPCGDQSEYVAWLDCVPFGPQIAWTPTSFDQTLNPTGACSTATESLFISSVGGEDLNWSIAENPPVNWLAESPLSGTLPPSQTATLNISFNAGGMAPGDYNTNLEITSNAPKGVVTVPVHLKVELPPDIDVATRLWMPVIPGCPNVRDFSVDNLGTGDLNFAVRVSGSPDPLGNGEIINKVPNRKAEDFFRSGAHQSEKSNLPKLTTSAPSDVSKAANVPSGPIRAPKNVQNIIWDNGGTVAGGNALSSQLDQVYPFVSQIADDFILTNAMSVTDVHWWGLFWNGTGFDPTDFYIYFYADDGTGNGPTGGGMPDPSPTALATYFFPAVTGLPPDANGFNEYNVTLSPPFSANAGVKYWIAIQAVFAYPPQWGWAQSSIIQLHDAMQGFPLLGYDFWTMDNYVDVAFYLTGESPCPMTVSPSSGTIPPSGHTDLTLTFDGTKFDVCGVDTTICYLVFNSNDCDESKVVVPVYMWAARGDVNMDCTIDIEDVVFLLNYVFKGGPAPSPLCVGDVNRSGGNPDSDDALYLISYLFLYGPPPEIPLAPKGDETINIKTNSPIR